MHVGGEEAVVSGAQEPMANDPIVAVLVVASLPLAAAGLLPQELAVPLLALAVAVLAALLPAWEAYRSDALTLLNTR